MVNTKQSSLESKQYFDKHRKSTRLELNNISDNKTISDRQKKALVDLLLGDVREKQSTEEFKKHMEVRKIDYKKIREFVIEKVGDPKAVTKKNIQDAVEFFYGKSETKESKETLPESAQSKKVKSMVSYSKENDQGHAEKIEGWAKTREKLRAKGIINDSSKGVDVKGLCSFASTESHNKVLKDNFGKKVKSPFDWKNHAGDDSQIDIVQEADLDKKMKKGGLEGDYKLASKKFITDTIFPWIKSHFENVETQKDYLFVMQMINPDLFTRLYLDSVDSSGYFRQAVTLRCTVNGRLFSDGHYSNIGGLFLVLKA